MAPDPLEQIEAIAAHTISTYDGVSGDISWVTGFAAAADAKEIVALVARIQIIDMWQCDECEAFVDSLAGGKCPLCYSGVTRMMVINRRLK